jgi:hypothetical protein
MMAHVKSITNIHDDVVVAEGKGVVVDRGATSEGRDGSDFFEKTASLTLELEVTPMRAPVCTAIILGLRR